LVTPPRRGDLKAEDLCLMVGFEHREDAERFWADLRDRLAQFSLGLNAEKTWLIELGRFASDERRGACASLRRFRFPGFTHARGKTRKSGRFKLKRITDSKRVRAKLRALKASSSDAGIYPSQSKELASVLRGHYNHYAVPDNIEAQRAFRRQVTWYWLGTLRRRSQRTTVNWKRTSRLADRWLPHVRITHPWPERRFDARTQGRSHALDAHRRICAGGGRQRLSLPRPASFLAAIGDIR
jgi:RNA-directed DNA polymerase